MSLTKVEADLLRIRVEEVLDDMWNVCTSITQGFAEEFIAEDRAMLKRSQKELEELLQELTK